MKRKENPGRKVFENAIKQMATHGVGQILFSKSLTRKRNIIRESLLRYYESTEEFEKCSFIVEFFSKINNAEISKES